MREYAADTARAGRDQEDYLVSIGMPVEMRQAVGRSHSNDPPRLMAARAKEQAMTDADKPRLMAARLRTQAVLDDDNPRRKIARQYDRIAAGR